VGGLFDNNATNYNITLYIRRATENPKRMYLCTYHLIGNLGNQKEGVRKIEIENNIKNVNYQ
jgi:hypothetical protein